jgi:nucleoside-diphosphate-sugar epimerase
MSRVVVTGGSGKLGTVVVEDLISHGYDVVNIDLVPPPVPSAPYTRADLTDYGQAFEVLHAIDGRYRGVDALVHLAAIPAPGLQPNATTFATNMCSTYNVFTAAKAAGITNIVWASSETVLGLPFDTPPPYLPVDEEVERPESAYSLTKLLGEHLAAQMCRQDPALKMIGLRFSNVMRIEDYERFSSWQDDARERMWNLWSYIDARDAAQAVRRSLEFEGRGADVFVIANADTVMRRPSAELAAELFPGVEIRGEIGEHETLMSIGKAKRVLGYAPEHSWRSHH